MPGDKGRHPPGRASEHRLGRSPRRHRAGGDERRHVARKVLLATALLLAGLPGILQAGANQSGSAWLSWGLDPSSPVTDLQAMPTQTEHLFIQIGNVSEIAGFDAMVQWYPLGATGSGCYETLTYSVPTSETDCTWLMRGNLTGLSSQPLGEDFWNPDFISDECNTSCTTGNVAGATISFASCASDIPGTFCISYMKLTDCRGMVDFMSIVGDATILGGVPTQYHPCLVTDRKSTWGSTKALYK